jgi:hypothetical protein
LNKETKVQRYTDKIVVSLNGLKPAVAEPDNSLISHSDQNVLANEQKAKVKGEFEWWIMPKELQPNYKRSKKDGTGVPAKKAKTVQDVEQKLKLLEQKEKTGAAENAKDGAKSDDDEAVMRRDVLQN